MPTWTGCAIIHKVENQQGQEQDADIQGRKSWSLKKWQGTVKSIKIGTDFTMAQRKFIIF